MSVSSEWHAGGHMENGMWLIWTRFCFHVHKAINPEGWQFAGIIMRILAMLSACSSAVRKPNPGHSPRHGPGPPLDAQMFPLNCYRFICRSCPRYKSLVSEIKFACPTRLGVLIGQGLFAPPSFRTSMKPLIFIASVRPKLSGDKCFIYSNFFLRSLATKWAVLTKTLLKVLTLTGFECCLQDVMLVMIWKWL